MTTICYSCKENPADIAADICSQIRVEELVCQKVRPGYNISGFNEFCAYTRIYESEDLFTADEIEFYKFPVKIIPKWFIYHLLVRDLTKYLKTIKTHITDKNRSNLAYHLQTEIWAYILHGINDKSWEIFRNKITNNNKLDVDSSYPTVIRQLEINIARNTILGVMGFNIEQVLSGINFL